MKSGILFRPYTGLATIFLAVFVFFISAVAAETFDLKPTRIVFKGKAKSEVLTIKNTGHRDLALRLTVRQWSQNEQGEDVYWETADLVIPSKILTLKKNQEQSLKVGVDTEEGSVEKAYRIYVEEVPSLAGSQGGAQEPVSGRRSIPVFVEPDRNDRMALMESLSLEQGRVKLRIKNGGNLRFIVTGIELLGEDTEGRPSFSRVIGGWYLLSGSSRVYETSLPLEACRNTAKLTIEVRTNNGVSLKDHLLMNSTQCGNTPAAYLYGSEFKPGASQL
jgi:fimbrial chaperone protein